MSKIKYLNTISELSKSLKLKINKVQQLVYKLKIEVKNNHILFSNAEKIYKFLNIPYQLEDVCKVKHELQVASLAKPLQHLGFQSIAFVGHVNHGKTTTIQKLTGHAISEEYKITQNLSIYKHKQLYVLDTPGHGVFSIIRSRIKDIIDISMLVISLSQGIEFETHTNLKFILDNQLEDRVIICFTKRDIRKYCEKALLKEIENKYHHKFDKAIYSNDSVDTMYSQIKEYYKEIPRTENSEYDGLIFNKIFFQKQQFYVLKILKSQITKKSFLAFESHVARIVKIVDIFTDKADSSNHESYVAVQTDINDLPNEPFYIVNDIKQAELYGKVILFNKIYYHTPSDSLSASSLNRNIVICVPDDITEKVVRELLEQYSLSNRVTIHIDIPQYLESLDKDHIIAIYNIKEVVYFKATVIYIDNIHNLINFMERNNSDILNNTQIESIAHILKIFNINNLKIYGCKVIKGAFSIYDNILATSSESEVQKSSKSTIITSIKQQDKFINKTKINNEVGIILSEDLPDVQEGGYIYKYVATVADKGRKTRKRFKRKKYGKK